MLCIGSWMSRKFGKRSLEFIRLVNYIRGTQYFNIGESLVLDDLLFSLHGTLMRMTDFHYK